MSRYDCSMCGKDMSGSEHRATCNTAALFARAERAEADVERLTSHVEEMQAEALGIEEGAPPEGTLTAHAILAIRALFTRAEKAEAEVERLRVALERIANGTGLTESQIARGALLPPTKGEP